ncbi:PEP-utilizing enzyme [Paenibacillus tarimensis]
MNTIRNFYPDEIEALKVILRTVYKRIHLYQEQRNEHNEIQMREAIESTMPYLLLFKEHIPRYKRKYIELLENQAQLKTYDLIICFDRAIYELHARVKGGEFADLPWSKELRDLLNERQEPDQAHGMRKSTSAEAVSFLTSGLGVSKGTVEGTACIVNNRDNLHRVKKGDILVTPMSDPEFVSVAHLISGLITDRGGMVCHAAILAREFNLPCIVGCKNATVAIKDSDRIQMDAIAGIVVKVHK